MRRIVFIGFLMSVLALPAFGCSNEEAKRKVELWEDAAEIVESTRSDCPMLREQLGVWYEKNEKEWKELKSESFSDEDLNKRMSDAMSTVKSGLNHCEMTTADPVAAPFF